MGALLGLGLGLGLTSIWSAFVLPRSAQRRFKSDVAARLLVRAGLPEVAPNAVFALSAVMAAVTFAIIHSVSRTIPVAPGPVLSRFMFGVTSPSSDWAKAATKSSAD